MLVDLDSRTVVMEVIHVTKSSAGIVVYSYMKQAASLLLRVCANRHSLNIRRHHQIAGSPLESLLPRRVERQSCSTWGSAHGMVKTQRIR